MMYRYLLDGTVLEDEPTGLEELNIEVTRDVVQRRVITRFSGRLSFTGDGHDYLKEKLESDGYCYYATLDIQRRMTLSDSWVIEQKGFLFLRDCTFDLLKLTCDAEIQDNGFDALIYNNQEIETRLDTGKSKNGVEFTRAATTLVDFFNPQDGIIDSGFHETGQRTCVELDEAFRHLVAFMTDDEVDFASDWYDNRPQGLELCILTGKELALTGNIHPVTVTFEFLFRNIANIYNLYLIMDYTGIRPLLRLEGEDYFYTNDINVELKDVRHIIQTVNKEFLYAKVELGSSVTDDAGARFNVRLLTPEIENYQIQGNCNTRTVFDIKTDIIYDSNIIEDVLLTGTPDWDDNIFLISFDKPDGFANRTDPLSLGNTLYNSEMWNHEILARYHFGGNIAKYLGVGDDSFFARRESEVVVTSNTTFDPFAFPIEDSDPGGNYNNSLYRYTAPGDGFYSFRTTHFVEFNFAASAGRIRGTLKQHNPGGSLKTTYPNIQSGGGSYSERRVRVRFMDANRDDLRGTVRDRFGNTYNTTSVFITTAYRGIPDIDLGTFERFGLRSGYIEIDYGSIYMETGDYVQISFQVLPHDASPIPPGQVGAEITIGADEWFECYNFQNGSGVFQASDALPYKSSQLEFSHPVSQEQIDALRDNPHMAIRVGTKNNKYFTTWNLTTKINRVSRVAEFLTLTDLSSI